ncbi:hypothetical protein JCM10908_002034 [Rhodotorula pacifica]|uniref:autophagy-related protein 27 n=1 Tax=Rhodotorula pacifica TaxID=1495444 RepID=UPI00317442BE
MRARTRIWTACAWLSSAALVHAAWDCSPLTVGGHSFDLSQLKGVHTWERESQTPPTVTKNRYALSLCSPLPDPSGDAAPEDDCPSGTRLCMRTFTTRSGLDDRVLSVVPIITNEADAVPSQKGDTKTKDEWIFEMGGGTYNGVDQRVKIDFKCDKGAKDTEPSVDDYDPKAGILYLSWTTSAACPTSNDNPPASPPPNQDDNEKPSEPPSSDDGTSARDPVREGMGFFGWFFTLLFLGFVGYFVLGAYHNRTTYGATGWDMVPHRDVWRDLPYVISDLIKGRGASRNGYSALG